MAKLIIVAGPSGAGKTSICDALLEHESFERVVTATTRSPREGEIDGQHYHFLDTNQFEKKIEQNEFLEYAKVFDNYYGTPISSAEEIIQRNKNALLIVDVQGAASIKKLNLPYTLSYFIMPPSLEELEKRLRNRKTESEESIQKRLKTAKYEITRCDEFDRILLNKDINKVVQSIMSGISHGK